MFRLHCILQKIKENQTHKSGSFLLKGLSLFTCLFLIGSCNEKTAFFDFSKDDVELSKMDKGELVRYSYAVQAALIQKPQNLTALNTQQAKLVLSAPDLQRVDGNKQVWQYRNQSCVLDIFWNAKGQATDYEFRARRFMVRGAENAIEEIQDWQCLQGLIQDRRRAIENGFSESYAVLSLNAHKS